MAIGVAVGCADPMSSADECTHALDAMVRPAGMARTEAHEEMAAGQKEGHWIWWVFPTLITRGGDMFSAMQSPAADLSDVAMATAYTGHPELRRQLMLSFRTAAAAFAATQPQTQVPWRVLDAGFDRQPEGAWLNGPVDSFKVFCSATLFASIAHKEGDDELRKAALAVLEHFTGDVVYSSEGPGSSGHSDEQVRNVLSGHDAVTAKLVGVGVGWEEVVASRAGR
mgnify:CR=1 FL=1